MTRGEVRRLLLAHRPTDEKERTDRTAMLELLEWLPEPLSRRQHVAHFTASALVVDPGRTRTALVHHRKLGIWVQPGGHLDDGDRSVGDAALREVREETGLEARLASERPVHLDVHEIPERPEMPAHLHLDVRFLAVADGDLALSAESYEIRWCSFAEAVRLGDASVARLVVASR